MFWEERLVEDFDVEVAAGATRGFVKAAEMFVALAIGAVDKGGVFRAVCLVLTASEAERLRDAKSASLDPFGSSRDDRSPPLRRGVEDHFAFLCSSCLAPALVCLERDVCLSMESDGFRFRDMLSKSLFDWLRRLLMDSLRQYCGGGSDAAVFKEGVRSD